MKLLRWAVAGASVYVVYRYSIGKKAKGDDVFVSPEREIAKLTDDGGSEEQPGVEKPKGRVSRSRRKRQTSRDKSKD